MNPDPKDDELCASIISNVIAGTKGGESRIASSPAPIIRNQAFALRQKLFGDFVPPSAIEEESESRAASAITTTQGTKSRNQAYELRKILFGPA